MKRIYLIVIALICVVSMFAEIIDVLDDITGVTVWETGNEYHVTDDLTVIEGVTLTIENDVTVKFYDGKRLDVYGHLIVGGNGDNEVVITSFETDGSWNGIKIIGNGTLFIENCLITKSEDRGAVYSYGSPQITIDNCTFEKN